MSPDVPPTPEPGAPPFPPHGSPDFWRACQRLSSHLDNLPLPAILWDHDFRVARWNEAAERLFGWTAAEALGRRPGPDWGILPPGEWEAVVSAAVERARAGEPTVVVTNRNLTKAGEPRWVEWRNSVLTGPAGELVSVLSVALDVTDRHLAGEALARTEAWMRDALDGAKMLGWELDLAANRWTTSADVPAFYGTPRGPDYTDPEVALTAVHPDDVPLVLAGRRRAIEAGGPMTYEFRGRAPAPDGSVRWFSTRGEVLRDAAGKPVRLVAITTDVTERKRAEAERAALDRQLLDAQKWESLGVLAGGVAHDFNNILTVILGGAALARRELPADSPAAPHLDRIEQACQRAADLCRQLLAYTGRAPAPSATVDLNQIIRASSALLEIPAARVAGLRFDLCDAVPAVRADAAQIRQVLVNLVMNAAEAVGEGGGEVRVATGVVDLSAAPAGYRLPPAPGRHVRLAVSDTGPGIAPDVLGRMFDPFFTTKFAGRGLGLSAVLGIVRSHGGALRVDTVAGRGTTFEVLWPAQPGSPPAAP
jgi:PAS domain S-box-containing protein